MRIRARLLAFLLLPAIGCATDGNLFGTGDPMRKELRRLEKEQLRMAHEARRLAEDETVERAEQAPTLQDRLRRGDDQLARGQVVEALWEYANAHRMAPEAAAPRVRLGYVHLRHDPERARPLFESALEIEPDHASAHTGMGLALLAGGERVRGLWYLRRAVELSPASGLAQAALGVALDQLGRTEEAIAHLEESYTLRPRDSRIMNNLGVAYLRNEEPERAEPLLRAALRQDRKDEKLRSNNLGMALALQGEFEEALSYFRRGGDEQAARSNLGYAHYVRGEYEQAIREYEAALVAGGDTSVEVVRNLKAARQAHREGKKPTPEKPPVEPGVSKATTRPLGVPRANHPAGPHLEASEAILAAEPPQLAPVDPARPVEAAPEG